MTIDSALLFTSNILKNHQYEDVTSFSSGEECLDELYQNPDIIFLDHNMEDLNGFEVLNKIKTL